MYNIILFWLMVFGIIYIFTRKEEKSEKIPKEDSEDREERVLKSPNRRDEIAGFLNDKLKTEEKDLELKRFNNRCFNCGSEKNLGFDHHLPLSRGYPLKSEEVGSNVVVLCKSCNEKKGNKLPRDFYSEEKLRKLEEIGVKSHLYYSPERMERIEQSLVSKKLEILGEAAKDKKSVSFIYLDRGRILFLEEEIVEVPLSVYSEKRIRRCGSFTRDWFLEGNSGRYYNIAWIYRLDINKEYDKLNI